MGECVSQYFSRGFAVALTIRLFVAVELAVFFAVDARTATNAADRERPAFFVDSNERSIWILEVSQSKTTTGHEAGQKHTMMPAA